MNDVQIKQLGAPEPPTLALARLPDGTMQLTLAGTVGSFYRCDVSADLLDWTPISTNLNQTGSFQIADPQATNLVERFYRAALVPQGD